MSRHGRNGPRPGGSGSVLPRAVQARLEQAVALHRAGDLNGAASLYTEIARAHPLHQDAPHLLGLVAYQQGRHAEALQRIDEAIRLSPNQASFHGSRGKVLAVLGRLDEALASFDRALALEARDADAQMNRAVVLQDLGRAAEALAGYDRVLAHNPGFAAAWHQRGIALHQLGRDEESAQSFERVIAMNPQYVDAHAWRAATLHRLGRSTEALDSCERAIALNPYHAEAWCHRGNVQQDRGEFASAFDSYERAVMLRADFAEAYLYRGNALRALGRATEALASYQRSLEIRDAQPQAHLQRGAVLLELGRTADALAAFDRAIALAPDAVQPLVGRGNALERLDRLEEALLAYDRALALDPSLVAAHTNRGGVLARLERHEESLASCTQALALDPSVARAHSNLGTALQALGRYDEAIAAYDAAIALEAGFAEAHANRGSALQQLGDADEALASYDRALTLAPEAPDARFNKALLLLSRGEFAQGWRLHEARWGSVDLVRARRPFSEPLWLGAESLRGRTVLLHGEQGLGDCLMFMRYAPRVAALGARVILELPSALLPLCTALAGVDEFVGRGEALPAFDLHCPLMSLPLAFGTTLETVPAEVPYLHADPERVRHWQRVIGTRGFRIGINWQGRRSRVDFGRSIPLAEFAPIAAVPGVRLISLQKHGGLDQLAGLPDGFVVETLGEDFDAGPGAFLDTAAVIAGLDLVITSDTSLAHLAGALGAPTFVALKHVPAWLWLLEGSTSPWYPSLTLFRQPRAGDWPALFATVAAAVAARIPR